MGIQKGGEGGDGVQKRVQKGWKLNKGEVQKVRTGRCKRMMKEVMGEQERRFRVMMQKGRIMGRWECKKRG